MKKNFATLRQPTSRARAGFDFAQYARFFGRVIRGHFGRETYRARDVRYGYALCKWCIT